MAQRWFLFSLVLFTAQVGIGCDDESPDADADGDVDADADVDGDGDTDGDGDVDSDSDGDGDGGAGPEPLELGEVVELDPDDEGLFELEVATPSGDEEFLLIVHPTAWLRWYPVNYEVEVLGTSSFVHQPMTMPEPEAVEVRQERPSPAHLQNLPLLVQALREGWGPGPGPLYAPDPPPHEGEVRTFSVVGDERIVEIEAEAVYISTSIAFWMDISSDPPATIEEEDLEEITRDFEEIILPRERLFFGNESDINEDSIIFIVMSAIVNENEGPMAYFSGCDLLDPGAPNCPFSNEAEILYLTPPNAVDSHMGSARAILETVAHELNHMIFFNTRYLQHPSTERIDNSYLQEGLAALAQDLTGYQAGNLFVAWYGLNDILDFAAFDVLDNESYYQFDRDGTLRGGAYLLMRYLYDQAGGDVANADGTFDDLGGIAFTQDLHNSTTSGLAALDELLLSEREDVILDFYTALALTNRGPDNGQLNDNPLYNYRPTQEDPLTERQRGFNAYAMLPMGSPMTGPATVPFNLADGSMRSTGVEYIEIPSDGGEGFTVHVTGEAEAEMHVRLVRIQ